MTLTETEKKRLLGIAQDLIRLESDAMRGQEGAAGNYIDTFYRRLGIKAKRQVCDGDRANIVVRIPGKDRGRCMMYSGHIDTVPTGDEKLWKSDPLDPQIREGRLYGRGSCDMKGSVACAMYAAEYMQNHHLQPEMDLLFVYDVDEENTNLGLRRYLETPERTDFIIVGEPTNLRLAVGHRGVMAFTVTIQGKSCHAGQAELGRNAIYAAADVIDAVRRLNKELERISQEHLGSPSIHVTQIQGGSKVNVVPDKAVVRIDRRLVFGEDRLSCAGQLVQILEKIQEKSGCDCLLEVTTYCPPGKTDVREPALRAISNLLEEKGIDNTPRAFEASCEAGMLQEKLGCPVVIWGPGSMGQAHKIDEFIELEQLYMGAELYIELFLSPRAAGHTGVKPPFDECGKGKI